MSRPKVAVPVVAVASLFVSQGSDINRLYDTQDHVTVKCFVYDAKRQQDHGQQPNPTPPIASNRSSVVGRRGGWGMEAGYDQTGLRKLVFVLFCSKSVGGSQNEACHREKPCGLEPGKESREKKGNMSQRLGRAANGDMAKQKAGASTGTGEKEREEREEESEGEGAAQQGGRKRSRSGEVEKKESNLKLMKVEWSTGICGEPTFVSAMGGKKQGRWRKRPTRIVRGTGANE